MDQVIAISGTPGTGKTEVGSVLATRLDAEFVELGQVIKEQRFHHGEDPNRDTLIADTAKLQDYLVRQFQKAEKQFVVVGHFADLVPKQYLAALIVLRCHPIVLMQRLAARQWSSKKILENIQAEILGTCISDGLAQHSRDRIFEIDTSDSSVEREVAAIEAILAGRGKEYAIGKISWLRILEPNLIHQIMEEQHLPSSSQKA
ncbi:MAG: adenylate kinase family protein [Promethearchaeota archaeon]